MCIMNIKWKVALLTLLGFSTAACCGTKKASKNDGKAPEKIEDSTDDPRIMLMYGVPFPDGEVARPIEDPADQKTEAAEFPDGSVAKPLTDERAEQIKEKIRKEKEAAKEAAKEAEKEQK